MFINFFSSVIFHMKYFFVLLIGCRGRAVDNMWRRSLKQENWNTMFLVQNNSMLFKKGSSALTCAGVMYGFQQTEAEGSIKLSGILVSSALKSDVAITNGCLAELAQKRNCRRSRRRRNGSRRTDGGFYVTAWPFYETLQCSRTRSRMANSLRLNSAVDLHCQPKSI